MMVLIGPGYMHGLMYGEGKSRYKVQVVKGGIWTISQRARVIYIY